MYLAIIATVDELNPQYEPIAFQICPFLVIVIYPFFHLKAISRFVASFVPYLLIVVRDFCLS